MKRADLTMAGALFFAFALSLGSTLLSLGHARRVSREPGKHAATLRDAAGNTVTLRPWKRFASTSILADRLLLDLAEPERIVGLSDHGFSGSSVAFRYGRRAVISVDVEIESIVSLAPDVLLVNNFLDVRKAQRLRGAGIIVFELGPMQGVDRLLQQIGLVAALVGAPERGDAYARGLLARLRGVAADIPVLQRKRAIYLGAYGSKFYGGTRGSSYYDVLTYGGLIDAAAQRYSGWPSYTNEDLLALAPEVVVTNSRQGALLCSSPTLKMLPACLPTGRVVELDPGLLVDPGPAVLDSAIAVREAVYGALKEAKP